MNEKKPPLDNPPQKFIKKSSLSYAIPKREGNLGELLFGLGNPIKKI